MSPAFSRGFARLECSEQSVGSLSSNPIRGKLSEELVFMLVRILSTLFTHIIKKRAWGRKHEYESKKECMTQHQPQTQQVHQDNSKQLIKLMSDDYPPLTHDAQHRNIRGKQS
jgi:hypothetical protein